MKSRRDATYYSIEHQGITVRITTSGTVFISHSTGTMCRSLYYDLHRIRRRNNNRIRTTRHVTWRHMTNDGLSWRTTSCSNNNTCCKTGMSLRCTAKCCGHTFLILSYGRSHRYLETGTCWNFVPIHWATTIQIVHCNNDTNSLEFTINRILFKIFKASSIDFIHDTCFYFNLSSVVNLIIRRKFRFFSKMLNSSNMLCASCKDTVMLAFKLNL
jgi:hypothetical protein